MTGESSTLPITGMFVAIGHRPNADLFAGILDQDEEGYLVTQPGSSATNLPGVFACGDVQDHIVPAGDHRGRLRLHGRPRRRTLARVRRPRLNTGPHRNGAGSPVVAPGYARGAEISARPAPKPKDAPWPES